MNTVDGHKLEESCFHKANQKLITKYAKQPKIIYKETIDKLLDVEGFHSLKEIEEMNNNVEYLQNYWQLQSSKFFLQTIINENQSVNCQALKSTDHTLKSCWKKPKCRARITDGLNQSHEPLKDQDSICQIEHKEKMLTHRENSSVLIDKSEFDIIDQAYKPGFVFEEYFKKNDINLSQMSWESKDHDIYEPAFTTLNTGHEKTKEPSLKDKKNFGIKYSFQVDNKTTSSGGLDYFLSEANMHAYKANIRSIQCDSFKGSPMIVKAKLTEPDNRGGNLMSKSRHLQPAKEKDPSCPQKPRGLSKKANKKQTVFQFKPMKKNQQGPTLGFAEEAQLVKFKKLEGLATKASHPQAAMMRTLKKKNSLLFIQTRSNSRDHAGEYKGKEVTRSTTKDREPFINKKKMRIRDRHENPQIKDVTNSALLKRKKKKVEVHENQAEPTLISKLLIKNLKKKADNGSIISNIGPSGKPLINLENSYLPDDLQGMIFESGHQRSPKYVKTLSSKQKIIDAISDSSSKPKVFQSQKNEPKKPKKASKSVNKKKTVLLPQKIGTNLYSAQGAIILPGPSEINIRKSFEKFGYGAKFFPTKSGKRDDLTLDLNSYNQSTLKKIDAKTKELMRSRPGTAEDMPYYSQRSKTTHKKVKEKKGYSRKKDETIKEPSKTLVQVVPQVTSINSPTKGRHFGKNSSSLIER